MQNKKDGKTNKKILMGEPRNLKLFVFRFSIYKWSKIDANAAQTIRSYVFNGKYFPFFFPCDLFHTCQQK